MPAAVPNWNREKPRRPRDYGPRLIRAIRGYERARQRGGPLGTVMRYYWAASHRFWSLITQCEIHLGTKIGGGLLLTHANGIIVHPRVVIGCNCLIFHQVTLGVRDRGVPRIGDNVMIGAGAKVLGPVTVGDNAVIGANAVVLCDVPAGHAAVGIPARIVPRAGGPADEGEAADAHDA